MQVEFFMQKENEDTVASKIAESFAQKPKKAYFFFGNLKDTGFKVLEEELVDSKAKIYFAIGVDKKNTTRSMLEDMLTYTKDIYYYTNNSAKEYNANICIFEYTNEAVIFIGSQKVSETSLQEDLTIYAKVVFSFEDEKEVKQYKQQVKNLTKSIEKELFVKLTKSKIDELIENKEIFSTRQYVHNVKSIAELLGKSENKTEEEKKDISENKESIEIPKIDLSDIDLDIDDIDVSGVEDTTVEIPANQEEKKDVAVQTKSEEIEVDDLSNIPDLADLSKLMDFEEENKNVIDEKHELFDESLKDMDFDENDTLDINDLLFSKADIKLDYQEEEEKEENKVAEDEIVKVKKVNLNHITNFIYELPSKTTKGQDVSSLKIPNYIQTMIPEFFELVDNAKNAEIDGANYKIREIKIEVVDVKNNQKFTDRKAMIMHKHGQSYLTFHSDVIKDIAFEESDIARIIKLASDVYHIEIIPKDMQEYKLWSKLCNQTFKSSTRKYGMM